MIRIRHGDYAAEIAPRGAELQSLSWRGLELMWQGDPAWWGRRAPVLFPVVGRLAGDTLRHRGRPYRVVQHGFARDLDWEPAEAGPDRARFRLRDSASTRAQFPFAFDLEQRFELGEAGLRITLILANPGAEPLPAALGLHPAFRWPLGEAKREAHAIDFDLPEPSPVRRLRDGLLAPAPEPTPVKGCTLALEDGLFERGALVFEALESRGLLYRGGSASLRLAWDFPHFALWTKPGAPFLCLEPWQGHPDPEAFAGEAVDRAGVAVLAPGAARSWSLSVTAQESLS